MGRGLNKCVVECILDVLRCRTYVRSHEIEKICASRCNCSKVTVLRYIYELSRYGIVFVIHDFDIKDKKFVVTLTNPDITVDKVVEILESVRPWVIKRTRNIFLIEKLLHGIENYLHLVNEYFNKVTVLNKLSIENLVKWFVYALFQTTTHSYLGSVILTHRFLRILNIKNISVSKLSEYKLKDLLKKIGCMYNIDEKAKLLRKIFQKPHVFERFVYHQFYDGKRTRRELAMALNEDFNNWLCVRTVSTFLRDVGYLDICSFTATSIDVFEKVGLVGECVNKDFTLDKIEKIEKRIEVIKEIVFEQTKKDIPIAKIEQLLIYESLANPEEKHNLLIKALEKIQQIEIKL